MFTAFGGAKKQVFCEKSKGYEKKVVLRGKAGFLGDALKKTDIMKCKVMEMDGSNDFPVHFGVIFR